MWHSSNGMVDFNKGEKQGGGWIVREMFLSLFFFVFFFPSPTLFAPATQADLNKISLQLLESLTF